jgi:polyhydroxyalkanoate synthase
MKILILNAKPPHRKLRLPGGPVNRDLELSEILQAIAEKSLLILKKFQDEPVKFPSWTEKLLEFSKDIQEMVGTLVKNPEKLWQKQIAYGHDAMTLSQAQMKHWLQGIPMPVQEKRFANEQWVNNPFFNLLSQHYLLARKHLQSLLSELEFEDKKLAKRISFLIRQYVDALSPENFIHTNPELLSETLQSQGKNLLKGLFNLLTDLENDSSQIRLKMTDDSAFKIGVNIAQTPGHVIFKNELMELIQYTPQTTKVNSIPLLIIPPWINKYYILDLSPGNSLIGWLVKQGISVFTISWFNPDHRYAEKGLYEYLQQGPLTAIQVIKKQLQTPVVNALGFCIGGTLLAILLAYQKARKDFSIKTATFLASMIDFSDPGDISVYIDEEQITTLEKRMNQKGYLEGHFMATAFNSLRATDLIWSFFIKNYLQGKDPVPFDILFWNADATNMPAKMHSQYLRWMYLYNDLIKPNKISLNGTSLDVTNVETPTFFVSTQKDHIAPWKTTYLGYQLMKGEKQFILGGSGHIAGIIIPPGTEKYGFYRNPISAATPDEWLSKAEACSGSWWSEWKKWLKKYSGNKVTAPNFPLLPYKSVEPAPGSYVFLQADKIPVQEQSFSSTVVNSTLSDI